MTDGETVWPWLCTTTWDRKHSPDLHLEVHEPPHRYFLQFLVPVMFIIQLIRLLEKTHCTHCIPESLIEANLHSHDCSPTYIESSIETGESSAYCKSITGVVFIKNTVWTTHIVWSWHTKHICITNEAHQLGTRFLSIFRKPMTNRFNIFTSVQLHSNEVLQLTLPKSIHRVPKVSTHILCWTNMKQFLVMQTECEKLCGSISPVIQLLKKSRGKRTFWSRIACRWKRFQNGFPVMQNQRTTISTCLSCNKTGETLPTICCNNFWLTNLRFIEFKISRVHEK